ncbi:beta-ketoacyl-[acyl-carrier-protein] synthase family protein [Avrilella dinanensis]|uniref:beta-ketoacyl-[acyl-carrier-protein] synthase family protein n=1 Tax=Avrilella dinanensis TaxID=2008672 RepID=UPI001FAEEEB6|nr:beta-ketoacyl synthase N-terminal-like domain-containing protein [Avrilella dinanensis]
METKNGNILIDKSIYISETNCITPLGFDVQSNIDSVLNGKSGISVSDKYPMFPKVLLGEIFDEELNRRFSEISSDSNFTRLEKLLILVLYPIVKGKKITEKSVLVLSTTKGNIRLLENQESEFSEANLGKLAQKTARFFGFTTEPVVVSNACVSGVLALSVAKRMLQFSDYKEAFVVAGDEISEFVISGFNSFQAMSDELCRPYDKDRKGINLGEAVAAVYLSKQKSANAVKILGEGSINDANHISGPSRTGEGLFRSMQSAFKEAGILPEQVDFISAHGTATLYNDEMEAIAFDRMNMSEIPIFSLKANYGHTLGASGLLETVVSIEALYQNKILPSLGFSESGVSKPITVFTEFQNKKMNYFLKTASGFGGCNTAVLFEKIINVE